MPKLQIRCYGSGTDYINHLKRCNINFVKQQTLSTTIVITEKQKRVFCNNVRFLSKREMMLQKQLLKDIKETTKDRIIIKDPKIKINYIKFDNSIRQMSDMLGEVVSVKNICEMDITKAYYKVAYNLNYISKEFYEKTLKLPKHIRLRLLGSIARRKIIETYEGEKLIDIKIDKNDRNRAIYNNIRKELDEIIIEAADAIQDYFLFYWVDGIYFKKDDNIKNDENQSSIQVLQYIFEKHNLEYTTKNIQKMTIINKNKHIYLQLYIDNKKKSEFYVPKTNVKQYYLENEQGFYETLLETNI
tara:strand:- start:2317 stop:3219 length:903 start_codon:yes stop_codon:yes gene_type:complete